MRGSARPSAKNVALVGVALLVAWLPNASASTVQADLEVAGPLILDGPFTWNAQNPVIDLYLDGGVPSYALTLTAARATVHVLTASTDVLHGGIVRFSSTPTYEEEEHELTDVALRTITLGPAAHLILDGDERGLAARATSESGSLFAAKNVYASADPEFFGPVADEVRPYFVHAQDQVVLEPQGVAVEAAGTLRLSLWDVRLVLDTAQGEREIQTGEETDPLKGSLGPYESKVRRIAWIDLQGADLTLTWAGPARLSARAPTADVTSLQADAARGFLGLDDLGLRPTDEEVSLTGRLSLRPTIVPGAPTKAIGTQVLAYERTRAQIGGDAETLVLSGALVRQPQGPNPLLAAGAGIGLLGLAAVAWRFGPLALAALYSRLEQGEILQNPLRAQIYDIVKHNPGINARGVYRLSDGSWGTVNHHLNKLCAAGYLVARHYGRKKCFYENHGKWDGQQDGLAALARAKTRRLAEAIAAVPGRDQGQLVARTQLSQSTVSFYLLELEKAQLVTKERAGGAWVYYATQALRDLLLHTTTVPAPSTAEAA